MSIRGKNQPNLDDINALDVKNIILLPIYHFVIMPLSMRKYNLFKTAEKLSNRCWTEITPKYNQRKRFQKILFLDSKHESKIIHIFLTKKEE